MSLKIQLNRKYKSFEPFEFKFTGDLIILSGVNGSGKTQIVDIIKGYEANNQTSEIERFVDIDGTPVNGSDIAHKSFRDYGSLTELTRANMMNFSQMKDQIYDWYNQSRLQYSYSNHLGNENVLKRARELLINFAGQEKFDRRSISRDDINKAIPLEFINYQDDLFTNKIGEIFWSYCTMVYRKQAEAGQTGRKFDSSSLPTAPWKILNDLLASLDLGYRFKDDYFRIEDEISDQPALYPIDGNGQLDFSQQRSLQQLSDGEKALISLTFAILATEQRKPKVLLLDEYDAPLNPSLTEKFFNILNEYFTSKGIVVIIVTHSATSLSLAPDTTHFYEIYRPNSQNVRILKVGREEYSDLRKVNKHFYDKISDQQVRLEELLAQNEKLTLLTDALQNGGKLQIVSEGNNFKYIQKAIEILAPELLGKVAIVRGAEGSTGKQQLKNAFDIMVNCTLKSPILFIWDADAENSVANLTASEKCRKYCLPRNAANTKILSGIENIFPAEYATEDLYDLIEKSKSDGGFSTILNLNKSRFETKMLIEADAKNFGNFADLIGMIKSLVNPKSQDVY